MGIDISLDLYKIFCAVVNTGSMSLAAKEMYISQPAISMAIQKLEDKLGKPLLIRSSKGLKPTPEGKVMFEYINQALSLIDTAESKYMQMLNLEFGEINIGASDTIISQFLLPYIEKYIETFSSINIKFTNRTTYETIRLLKNGLVDIGFVNLPIEDIDSFDIFTCLQIHDCIVAGAKYANLKEKGISLSELNNYPLMLLETESNTRKYLDHFCTKNGIVLKPNIELGCSDLLVKFAKINLGLAAVIREFSSEYIDNKTIFEIPIYPSPPPRAIGLVKLKGVALSHAATSFINLILQ